MPTIQKNELFHTPASVDELMAWVMKNSGGERVAAMTAAGMALNLAVEVYSKPDTGPKATVHLSGYKTTEGGDEEYCDDPDQCDGYTVYLRTETPEDNSQPFDVTHDANFTTYEAAADYAGRLALSCGMSEWDWSYD